MDELTKQLHKAIRHEGDEVIVDQVAVKNLAQMLKDRGRPDAAKIVKRLAGMIYRVQRLEWRYGHVRPLFNGRTPFEMALTIPFVSTTQIGVGLTKPTEDTIVLFSRHPQEGRGWRHCRGRRLRRPRLC